MRANRLLCRQCKERGSQEPAPTWDEAPVAECVGRAGRHDCVGLLHRDVTQHLLSVLLSLCGAHRTCPSLLHYSNRPHAACANCSAHVYTCCPLASEPACQCTAPAAETSRQQERTSWHRYTFQPEAGCHARLWRLRRVSELCWGTLQLTTSCAAQATDCTQPLTALQTTGQRAQPGPPCLPWALSCASTSCSRGARVGPAPGGCCPPTGVPLTQTQCPRQTAGPTAWSHTHNHQHDQTCKTASNTVCAPGFRVLDWAVLTACTSTTQKGSWHTHDTGQDTSNQPQLTPLPPRQPWQPCSCRTPVRARSTHRQPALHGVDTSTSTSSSSNPSQVTQQGTSCRHRLQTEAEANPTAGLFESFLVKPPVKLTSMSSACRCWL